MAGLRLSSCVLATIALLPPSAFACEQLQVSDAWIRQAPPGAGVMAGYARLSNRGKTPLQIRSVAAADFASAEIHESRRVGDSMQMRRADPLTLAPGQTLVLAPSGYHLMLMSPRRALAPSSPIVFDCKDGPLALDFPVREAAAE